MEHFEMMFDDGGMDRSYTAWFKMFAKNHRYHLQLVHRQALEVWQLLNDQLSDVTPHKFQTICKNLGETFKIHSELVNSRIYTPPKN